MDVLLPIAAALLSASAVTALIFYLSRGVDRWTARQMSLCWITGLAAIFVLLVATANVPKHRELIPTRCDPAREDGCRATGAPRISASGDTACCYPGVMQFTLESKTPAGEAAKIGLIMLAVGTGFGLFMLTSAWMRRSLKT